MAAAHPAREIKADNLHFPRRRRGKKYGKLESIQMSWRRELTFGRGVEASEGQLIPARFRP
jgi:hypothetical protein